MTDEELDALIEEAIDLDVSSSFTDEMFYVLAADLRAVARAAWERGREKGRRDTFYVAVADVRQTLARELLEEWPRLQELAANDALANEWLLDKLREIAEEEA